MTVTGTIWRDQLTADQRAMLGRDIGTIADTRPDVLVIGGGILGVAIAAAVHGARLGSVQLIEAGRLGAGATGGATGLLIPEPHQWSDPETFVDMERASLERWRYLDQVTPGGLGLVELDWIGLAPDPGGLAAHQPENVEWLDASKIAALVPGLAWRLGGALIRHQARVNPLRALVGLAAELPSVGTGVAATGITIRGETLESVTTSAGEISPGAVVFATGQPPAIDGLAIDIPSDRVKGHLIVTAPTKVHLPCTVAPVATPLEDGRLLAGGTFDYGDESPVVREEVVETIMGGLRAALPAVKDVGVSHQWCCFRPRHPDRRPVIDRVPGLRNAWLTSGHFRTGILNAPATGMAITRWINADKPPPEARAWSAGRFAARGSGGN
ncbi:MAG TPA: FAD-binding oxidoreductase [Streptosporangiaceae bacterium]|jgi:glycine oxidase|nr:FAD-binding oxidoreductase [Streptosporangiaceae bacterium]